ncbi:HVA22-like protein f [Senna tora]|uniref:HVA22-like protein f n=1 Tax=Senna tora TaxID=362788 RepID=A0A834T5P1_9FABA|nr:HVA22-like protein f [Senna tora]
MFNGAAYIYENFVRQYIIKNIGSYGINYSNNNNYGEEHKKALQMMSFDARKAVESYIQRFGPDAFERVIRAAEKEATKQ